MEITTLVAMAGISHSPDRSHEAVASLSIEPLDAVLDATELDIGGQLCTTTPQYVIGLSHNAHSESMVDSRSENS